MVIKVKLDAHHLNQNMSQGECRNERYLTRAFSQKRMKRYLK